MSQALASQANLSPSQRQEYEAAAHAIFDEMTDAGLQRFNANVKGYRFFPDTHQLSLACRPGYATAPAALRPYLEVLGAYNETTQELEIDGGGRLAGFTFTTQDRYAHEFGHALDGPGHDISNTRAWRDAWTAEIVPSPPTPNAATNEQEGFAAFSGMLYQTNADRALLEQTHPQCAAVWRAHQLW